MIVKDRGDWGLGVHDGYVAGGTRMTGDQLLDVERFRRLPHRQVARSEFLQDLGQQRLGWDVGSAGFAKGHSRLQI